MARNTPNSTTPGHTDAWVMLGYLAGAIEAKGRITIDDWNGAIRAGDDAADRVQLRLANHADRSGA